MTTVTAKLTGEIVNSREVLAVAMPTKPQIVNGGFGNYVAVGVDRFDIENAPNRPFLAVLASFADGTTSTLMLARRTPRIYTVI